MWMQTLIIIMQILIIINLLGIIFWVCTGNFPAALFCMMMTLILYMDKLSLEITMEDQWRPK